jgi:hypothetical protein
MTKISLKGVSTMAERQPTLEEKMAAKTKEELVAHVHRAQLQERLLWAKSLIDMFGKEQAKRIIHNTLYPIWYDRGRADAAKLGYPQDMDSFAEMVISQLARNPITPAPEVVERTKNRFVLRMNKCFTADAYFKFRENPDEFRRFGGEEAFEVIKTRCDMDTARYNGFNPRLKIRRTKFFMDGDGCCEYVVELEE